MTINTLPAIDDLDVTQLELPGSDAYLKHATPWNVAVSSQPMAVVVAHAANDVQQAVRWAGSHDIGVAVQLTGHGAAAGLDTSILIHTGLLDECVIHPEGWARVGAGVRWAQVLEAAAPHGLAPLAGSAPDVGVVGYTTGGGLGPVARSYGFASDRVRAFEVVTGDGQFLRATPAENPDLFWGLRGGKGALGIVTAVEFDLVRLTEIYGGALYFNTANADEVFRAWSSWCKGLPEEATTSAAFLRLPPAPGVPEPLAGRTTLSIRYAWVGAKADGERTLAPMRAIASPLIDAVGPMPYADLGAIHSDPVDPMPVHEEHALLAELPPSCVEVFLAHVGNETDSPQIIVELRQLGGAIARHGEFPSAVSYRGAAFSLLTIGLGVPPVAEVAAEDAAGLITALDEWVADGALPNFAAGNGRTCLTDAYDGSTLDHLLRVAHAYDPNVILTAHRALAGAEQLG
jgi:hypothetical protein